MKKKQLLKFASREECAKFWDRHELTDYLNQTEEVDELFVLAPELAKRVREKSKKKAVTLRLPEWQVERARRAAMRLHQPYQSILRGWVERGILAEARGGPPRPPKSTARTGGETGREMRSFARRDGTV